METADTRTLLARFAADGSEAAFRELVLRYVNLVYSTALRLVAGHTAFAEDVSQTVFIDLAREAHRLSSHVMLGGWLHRRTCHVAAAMLRHERRRQIREKEATDMDAQPDHTQSNLAQVMPFLDEAINQLNAKDRAAILLRFFEQRDFRSVGAELNSSEDAARMRVERALDKLHSHLNRRGVRLGIAALATGLTAEAVTAAPAGLAAAIAGTALKAATLGGGKALTLMKVLTSTKAKVSIAGGLAVVVIATLVVTQYQAESRQAQVGLRIEKGALEEQLKQAKNIVRERDRSIADTSELERLRQAQNELPRLREELDRLLQRAVTAESNHIVETTIEDHTPTNIISGFTPLHAKVHAQVAFGQTMVVGTWSGHPGARIILMVTALAPSEGSDQMALDFQSVELPETLLERFGLGGLGTGDGTVGTILSPDRAKALWTGLETRWDEMQKAAAGAGPAGKYLHYFGNSVIAPIGKTTGVTTFMATYNGGGYHGTGFDCNYGEHLMIDLRTPDDAAKTFGMTPDTRVFDLGPYYGPYFVVTPIMLGDGKSIDLSAEITMFWHFNDFQ